MKNQTYMTSEDQERAISMLLADPTVVSADTVAYNVNYHSLAIVTLHHLDNSETTVQLDRNGFQF